MRENIISIHLTKISVYKKIIALMSIPLLTTLGAYLRVYLPFTPVPITFQTYFVLVSAALCSFYVATSGQLLYILAGIIGLNVFANGVTGIVTLLHPTFGYLVGFLVASLFVSNVVGEKPSIGRIFLMLLAGNFIIYFFGVLRLSYLFGLKKSILIGVIPFIYGDLLKIFLATVSVKSLKRYF